MMHNFERTFGVGSPFGGLVFSGKNLQANDLVHVYSSLTPSECEKLSVIISGSDCWVRVAPRPGHSFEEMSWISNLICNKLWLDLTTACRIEISDIEQIDPGTRELLLPFRSGNFFQKLSLRNHRRLELLGISGTLPNLHFLEGMNCLRELRFFRVKLGTFAGIETLSMLKTVQIERSTVASISGIVDAMAINTLIIMNSRVGGPANFGDCLNLERLELAMVTFANGLTFPASKVKLLRLISTKPQPSLEDAWGCERLEFLSNDRGLADLASGYAPKPHPTLKMIYLGPIERSEARSLSRELGVQVAEIENDMPFAFF